MYYLSIFCNNLHCSPDLTIALLYRPPNSCPTLLDSLFCILYDLDATVLSNFVLLGDFSTDYFCTQHFLYAKLCSVTDSFNLTQVVTEPTRVTSNSCTLIDLIFVSSPSQVNFCNTIPPLANSDHLGLELNISVMSPKRQTSIPPRRV